jgi:virginiamycin B lyase
MVESKGAVVVAISKRLTLRRVAAWLFAGFVVTLATVALAGPAGAITPTISEYPIAGSEPEAIAAGPDGNLWFTDAGNKKIGRINPATQAIDEFGAGLNSGNILFGITAGPDGNLWFTDEGTTKAIGRINPTTHAISEFDHSNGLNTGGFPEEGIAGGPDGNVWFTDDGTTPAIGRITPSGTIDEFSAGLKAGSGPGNGIAAGPDGNLWFTDAGTTKAIGRINPTTHAISEFDHSNGLNTGGVPGAIVVGPDGNLWFTDGGTTKAIGRINPTTQAISEFSAGLSAGSYPQGIAVGSDGNLWFGERGSPAIGRINPTTHAISEFSAGLLAGHAPAWIAAGADGNLWFADDFGAVGRITTPPAAVTGGVSVLGSGAAALTGTVNGHAQPSTDRFEFGLTPGYGSATPAVSAGSGFANASVSATLTGLSPNTTFHYRLDATNPTDTTAGADATFTTLALPAVGPVSVNPKTWRRGSRLAQIQRRRRVPVGTKIIFSLNRAAPVQLAFFSPKPGHKVKKRCVAPTRKNRKARKCTRLVLAGTLSFTGHAGKNTVRFQGRISKTKSLKPGRYQLKVTATDPTTPIKSPSRTASFTIVKG